MIDITGVFAVDGHDGAGKTTLARWLATKINGVYQRPFHGALGSALLSAADHNATAQVISIGEEGIGNALAVAGSTHPVILDRAWMTVASLIDWEAFVRMWNLWIPTVLCWADLSTTLERLDQRTEQREPVDEHSLYLDLYRSLAERTGTYILRTDLRSISESQNDLLGWFNCPPSPPHIDSGFSQES